LNKFGLIRFSVEHLFRNSRLLQRGRLTEKQTIIYSLLLGFNSFSLSEKTGSIFLFFSLQLHFVFVSIQFHFYFILIFFSILVRFVFNLRLLYLNLMED